MAPERETTHRKGKTAAQRLCHRWIIRETVAAPVYRELLSACRCTSCKQHCLLLSLYFLKQIEYCLVVQIGVIIVHRLWITAIVVRHIDRDTLAEIRLEAVHAALQDRTQLVGVPFYSILIREIYQSHAGLPVIGLPYALSVRTLQKITILHALAEKCSALRDVRIDPCADLQSLLMITLQCAADIREAVLIPLEITPVERLHPEAIKMKYAERNATVDHTIDKGACRLFVIIGRKGSRQPQSKGPCRRQCRTAGQCRIAI